MADRASFAAGLARIDSLSHVDRAVALLWYYQETQEYEERTASELANDLRDEGFPKPNVTRLNDGLSRSRQTVRGRRKGTFQIDVRRIGELAERYGDLVGARRVDVTDSVLRNDLVFDRRVYLERMVHQINGSYDNGFYDACAVLCRRLMESLLIEIYVVSGRHEEVQKDGVFIGLEGLIRHADQDRRLVLGRTAAKTMLEIKQMGDTAAHDRVYITTQRDVDDVRGKYRRLIDELMTHARVLL